MTCDYDGYALHSKYNPEKEAETFVKNLSCPFVPKAVVVIAPALSYCAEYLKKKFHGALLCAIRFSDDFSDTDCLWDKVFFYDERQKIQRISDAIFDFLGEEILAATFFVSWQPSSKIFPSKDAKIWSEIKTATEKSRSVLFTRSYFASKWMANVLKFVMRTNKTATVEKGNAPVVVAASGPSLAIALDALKKHREKFFLIAVSSAVAVCQKNGITPDLCMTTDGGYWAERHFDFSPCDENVCVAQSVEGAVPSRMRKSCRILPLCYSDGMASVLASECGFEMMKAERNGTVSGTALMFALQITDRKIFICGLDLCPSPASQHAMPNALDNINSCFENRTATKETASTAARFRSSESLGIYRAWFSSLPFEITSRVFRVTDGLLQPLGKIQDIDTVRFEAEIKKVVVKNKSGSGFKNENSNSSSTGTSGNTSASGMKGNNECAVTMPVIKNTFSKKSCAEIKSYVKKFIRQKSATDEWMHEFFPAEYVSMERSVELAAKQKMQNLIFERNEKMCLRLRRLVTE